MFESACRRNTLQTTVLGAAFSLALLVSAQGAWAQEPPAAGEAAAEEADAPRWSFFGYLTQAYAKSDGNQILGITDEGTADYRALAVQMRYQRENDALVVQLSHERLGESPFLQQFKDDVELDWGFYQRSLGSHSSLRVGRVPIPLGIYNEIRDVGTLLPFFRPPVDVYGEVANASETLDGITVSHTFGEGSDWGLEAEAYFGNWEFPEQIGLDFGLATVSNGVGAQLWLNTPVSGLRVGAAGQKYKAHGGARRPRGVEEEQEVIAGSVEGDFDRVTVRSEYRRQNTETGNFRGYYGQLSIRLTQQVGLHLQGEASDLYRNRLPKIEVNQDLAVGLSYQFAPSLVLKGEFHDNEGFRSEDPVARREALKTKYGIVSLSAAF